jgi:hypothetical protein
VGQKDNAGKLEVIKKLGDALGNKPVNVSFQSPRSLVDQSLMIIALQYKILQTIQDVEQRKTALFIEKEYEFGAVQSFFVLNFDESGKITHTVEFVNAEAQKKLMSRLG